MGPFLSWAWSFSSPSRDGWQVLQAGPPPLTSLCRVMYKTSLCKLNIWHFRVRVGTSLCRYPRRIVLRKGSIITISSQLVISWLACVRAEIEWRELCGEILSLLIDDLFFLSLSMVELESCHIDINCESGHPIEDRRSRSPTLLLPLLEAWRRLVEWP